MSEHYTDMIDHTGESVSGLIADIKDNESVIEKLEQENIHLKGKIEFKSLDIIKLEQEKKKLREALSSIKSHQKAIMNVNDESMYKLSTIYRIAHDSLTLISEL